MFGNLLRAALSLLLLIGTAGVGEDPQLRPAGRFRAFDAHGDLIRWLGYSPDGKQIATASFDKTLRLSDAVTGKRLATLAGHVGQIAWGSFSQDGRRLASGSFDGAVHLWRLDRGGKSARIEHLNPVRSFIGHRGAAWAGVLSPDATRIVSGGPGQELIFWNARTGKAMTTLVHRCAVHWIDGTRDAKLIAMGDAEGRIGLYEATSGKLLRTFGDHTAGIYGITFSPDGSRLASASGDGTLKLWDPANGRQIHAWPHFGAVYAAAFSADGAFVASAGADYTVQVFEVRSGAMREHLTGPRDELWSVAFSPDGKTLATAGNDGKLYLTDWQTDPIVPKRKLPPRIDLRPAMAKWGLNVVSQGPRGTCSVHTFTRAMEFALSRHLQRGEPLSDEYFNWATNQVIGNRGPSAVDRGQFFEHLWMGCCKHGLCSAREMPFTAAFDPGLAPSEETRQTATSWQNKYPFVYSNVSGPGVSGDDVVRRVKTILTHGWPVLAGSAHSLLVVGYIDDAKNPGGGRFIVADSGAGGFIDTDTGDKLHSAIVYSRVGDYGFAWIYVDRRDTPKGEPKQ